MHTAPPVSLDLAPGQLERAVIVLLHALAFSAVAVWGRAHAPNWEAPWWVLVALSGVALGRLRAVCVLPPRRQALRWTGAAWQLGDALVLHRLDVQLDLGPWMLLRAQGLQASQRRWLVASARAGGAAWHGLRVALQAHAGRAVAADGDAVTVP